MNSLGLFRKSRKALLNQNQMNLESVVKEIDEKMSLMEKKVFDPLGNAVIFSDNLLPLSLPDNEVAVDASMAITHPVMIIETTNGSERYYLRTIEWDIRILVKVKKVDDAYIADQCQINPTVEQIQELLKKGKQIK